MWVGFFSLMVLIGGAIVAGIYGKDILAVSLLGTSVVGSVGVFVTGQIKK